MNPTQPRSPEPTPPESNHEPVRTGGLERRAFLASSAASLLAGVTGCEATDGDGDTDTIGGGPTSTTPSTTPSSATSTTPSSATSTTPTTTPASATSNVQPTPTATSGAPTTSPSATQTSSTGASGAPNTSAPSNGETSAVDPTSAPVTSSEAPTLADDACFEGGGTDGGASDDAGAGVLCSTNTDNGDHCHALIVPRSDATAGFAEATYTLEDGGTGHTHTITITAYDFFYLEAGIAHTIVSTEEGGHYHVCLITCPPS